MTGKRAERITAWCQANFADCTKSLPSADPLWLRLSNKILRKSGIQPKNHFVKMGELSLWSSMRGRTFPTKSWDQEYFDFLSHSRSVLCPNGDFVWSYRFFEAILCGAVPIVEESCDAYKGFTYNMMDEPFADIKWDADAVEHNYKLCLERISIPIEQMNDELQRLLVHR